MIATAVMLYCPPSVPWDDVTRERLARHRWVWLKTASEVLADPVHFQGPTDFTDIREKAAELKAINPDLKVGLYSGGFCPDVHNPHYEWLADEDLLHDWSGRPAVLTTEQPAPGYENRRMRAVNYGREATRSELIDCWVAFLDYHDLDGVFFDSFQPRYHAAWMQQAYGLVDGAREGPVHTADWWAGVLAWFTADLRTRLHQDGREVWANGLANDPVTPGSFADRLTGTGYCRLVDYADGVLSEMAVRGHVSLDQLAGTLKAVRAADASGQVFLFFQPPVLAQTDPSYTGWQQAAPEDLHRFFLAYYLLVASERTLFGYHDGPYPYSGFCGPSPHTPYVFDGGADWERDYGTPLEAYVWRGDGIVTRRYDRGLVVLNQSAEFRQVALPGPMRLWDPVTGYRFPITTPGQVVNVNPKSGWFCWQEG